MDTSRSSRRPVGALPASSRIFARYYKSAAGGMVYAGGNLEQEGTRGRDRGDGSEGRAAGAAFPGAGNRRGLQQLAFRGAQQAGSVRARVAGSQSGEPGSHPIGAIFERNQEN